MLENISNTRCSFDLHIHRSIPPNNSNGFHKNIKQHNFLQLLFWAVNQRIRMISEGSCDIKDLHDACSLDEQTDYTF